MRLRTRGRAVRSPGRTGDRMLFVFCALAGVLVLATLVEIVYQLITNSSLAISHFGLGFLVHQEWNPHFGRLVPARGRADNAERFQAL